MKAALTGPYPLFGSRVKAALTGPYPLFGVQCRGCTYGSLPCLCCDWKTSPPACSNDRYRIVNVVKVKLYTVAQSIQSGVQVSGGSCMGSRCKAARRGGGALPPPTPPHPRGIFPQSRLCHLFDPIPGSS